MAEQPGGSTRPAKTMRQVLEQRAPWKPAPYEPLHAAAVQAMAQGRATTGQQKALLDWIIVDLCRTYDMSYRPGAEEGRRDTDFAEGRRSVGLQLVMLSNIKLGLLPRRKDE